MSWFEEWFDSPLYETLYANRNEEEARLLASLIEKEIPNSSYPKLLDLGCGRGRHSLTLAERGYHVTGIDLSEEAIKKARSKAEDRKILHATFEVGDMRDPLPYTFDAIVNLFTTFGYFLNDSENIRVLKSAGAMLKTGGLFMQDYLNRQYVMENLVPNEEGIYSGFRYRIKRYIKDGMVFKRIRFSSRRLTEPVEYQERVKLYSLDWFKTHLRETGFEPLKTFGDYKGGAFKPGNSSRLLMISRKK
jgi:SAM-dependent methyltransferase